MEREHDLIIVVVGISGASLLYTVSQFTDIDSVALFEKEASDRIVVPAQD